MLSKLRTEKEAWITAIFALGLMKAGAPEIWIGINDDDSAPDTYCASFRAEEGKTYRDLRSVEVFEWEEHGAPTLPEAISSKLENKKYPEFYTLLCYIHSRDGQVVNPKEIFDSLKDQRLSIGEIWVVAGIEEGRGEYTIIRIYPKPAQLTFSAGQEAQNHESQIEVVKVRRGTGVGWEDLGELYISAP